MCTACKLTGNDDMNTGMMIDVFDVVSQNNFGFI